MAILHRFYCTLLFSRITSEWQTAYIQIWPDVLLRLLWVQTVCKDHQQTTLLTTTKQRVKRKSLPLSGVQLWLRSNSLTIPIPCLKLATSRLRHPLLCHTHSLPGNADRQAVLLGYTEHSPVKINTSSLLLLLLFVCLFCCFMSQANSYGHCGTDSSPNHTFFLGRLEQAVNQ